MISLNDENDRFDLWGIIMNVIRRMIGDRNFERLVAAFYIIFPPDHIPEDVYRKAKSKNIDFSTILAILGMFAYVLSIFDAVPDFLPGGYVDDVGVIVFGLDKIKNDLDGFIEDIRKSGYELLK